MGPEWKSKYICVFLVALQLWLSVVVQKISLQMYLLTIFTAGATISQALLLAVHELSHNLFFRSDIANRAFSMFVNIPIGIPFCESFRHYHMQHHRHLGREGVDTDLPSQLEKRAVRGSIAKLLWIFFQIFAYALRPILVMYEAGTGPLIYLLLCLMIAGGCHPCAGHFISEHYVFPHYNTNVQETFSYYGVLNKISWNVGYHNEHHDFTTIPWSRLPELRRIASEYYDDLAVCSTWPGCVWTFVSDSSMGPARRVLRTPREKVE